MADHVQLVSWQLSRSHFLCFSSKSSDVLSITVCLSEDQEDGDSKPGVI